jgi:NADPH:quinone reductase-like Zn-dependent oxidoreductase
MKVFIVDRYKSKEGLRFGNMPDPELRDEDVMVQVHAASVIPLDAVHWTAQHIGATTPSWSGPHMQVVVFPVAVRQIIDEPQALHNSSCKTWRS